MAVFTVTLACRRTSAFIFKSYKTLTSVEQDVDAEVERIKEAMGAKVDITFDCAGFNKTMSTAFGATSSGGKVCLVGMGHSEMTLPLAPAAVRQFICIGRFTAVSFQVLGHMKTILVLILRFLFFKKEGLNLQVVIGMVIAVIGMVWYGNASSKPGGKERRSYSIPRSSQQKHGGLSESSEVDEKFFHQDPCTYSTENIDKIRDLWAKYVLELEQDDANEDGMDIA